MIGKFNDMNAVANFVLFNGSTNFFFKENPVRPEGAGIPDEETIESFNQLPKSVRVVLVASSMVAPDKITRTDYANSLKYLNDDEERQQALAFAVDSAIVQGRDIRFFVETAVAVAEHRGWEVPEYWREVACAQAIIMKFRP
jgi:nucleotide-binding universal stress UspA family protein